MVAVGKRNVAIIGLHWAGVFSGQQEAAKNAGKSLSHTNEQ
jgi:hypothetical protein